MIGNPSTTLVADATLTVAVNDALREIWAKYRWHKAEKRTNLTTTASVATVTLPSGCESVLMLYNSTTGQRIRKAASTDRPETYLGTTGAPQVYFRDDGILTLFPVPDATYTLPLRYRGAYTDLANGSDTLFTPDAWISAVLRLARFHYYDTYGADPAKARESYNLFVLTVNDLPLEADEEAQDTLLGVSLGQDLERVPLDFDHED